MLLVVLVLVEVIAPNESQLASQALVAAGRRSPGAGEHRFWKCTVGGHRELTSVAPAHSTLVWDAKNRCASREIAICRQDAN
jgi:hypothetical protein